MKVLIRSYHIILLLLLLFSCKDKDSNNEKKRAEISFRYYNLENMGWKSKTHTQKVDSINFIATEVPIQYYLLKNQGNKDLLKVDSIYEINKRERIIEFEFEEQFENDLLQEKYTHLDYESSVKYMSFEIEKDFYAVVNKDTILCSGALFERTFKIAPKNKLMLFFSNIDPNKKIQLVYQDRLFKKGTLKFRFKDPILKL